VQGVAVSKGLSQPGVALVTPLSKPLRVQSEQAYIVTSAALGGKVSQNFTDYAAKLETMTRAGRRDGDLWMFGVGTNDEVLIWCCGVPAAHVCMSTHGEKR
jgi:hypothetical protein